MAINGRRKHVAEQLAANLPHVARLRERKRRTAAENARAQSDIELGRPETFREFVDRVTRGRFKWYRHCEVIADIVQRVVDGELTRVLVSMPPRHGKTEQISRLASAYYLYRHPDRWVALCSYAAELAYTLSRAARTNYRDAGGELDPEASAVKHWQTMAGGGLWAAGVDGPATGKGFHLGIIDDPLKNAADASSIKTRNGQREWYRSVFSTREEPGGAIIIIQTRWHEDDLTGWVLEEEREELKDEYGEPEGWHIVRLAAVRPDPADDRFECPSSCTMEPDWREPGEALCPERYPLQRLKRLARRVGSYFWAALFQQSPSPADGTVLQRAWFASRIHISQVPRLLIKIVGSDLAVTEETTTNDPDYTVAFPIGMDAEGRYYLFRPYRERVESPDALRGIAAHTKAAKARMLGVEQVGTQKGFIQTLRRAVGLAGIGVKGIPPNGNKVARCRTWSPVAEAGLITLVVDDGPDWVETFLAEAIPFPNGSNDDQIDAVGVGMELLGMLSITSSRAGGKRDDLGRGLR